MPGRGRRRGKKPKAEGETKDDWINGRCFGAYCCPKCKRSWNSASSWLGYGQKCFKCHDDEFVLPLSLKKLRRQKRNPNDPKKAHIRSLCQKCVSTGSNCRNIPWPKASAAA